MTGFRERNVSLGVETGAAYTDPMPYAALVQITTLQGVSYSGLFNYADPTRYPYFIRVPDLQSTDSDWGRRNVAGETISLGEGPTSTKETFRYLETSESESTPTLSDVWKRLVAFQAQQELNYILVSRGMDRIFYTISDKETDGDKNEGSLSTVRVRDDVGGDPSADEGAIIRNASLVVLGLTAFALLAWVAEGFVLIHPLICVVLIIGSITFFGMSFVPRKKLEKAQ